jgi:hypothetical protein
MVIDQLAKGGDAANRSSKGQNLYNAYQTRSYTCEVECMGNLMIQPMMYFQLENVPMFWGAYLITDVKHNMKPHYVTTTFTGVRVPKIVIPLVTDAMSTMSLGQGDPAKNGGSTQDFLDKNGIKASQQGGSPTILPADQIFDDEEVGSEVVSNPNDTCPTGVKTVKNEKCYRNGKLVPCTICLVPGITHGVSSEIAQNVVNMMAAAKADGVNLSGSGFRTMATAKKLYKDNCGNVKANCSPDTAIPGTSNHQTGLAMDLGVNYKSIGYYLKPALSKSQIEAKGASIPPQTKADFKIIHSKMYSSVTDRSDRPGEFEAFEWLVDNAHKYGLKNYYREPWHWSTTGT